MASADHRRQSRIGLGLGLAIAGAWIGSAGWALFVHRPGPWEALIAPAIVAWLTWLQVGLFIVAHDAMHGSLAPAWPRLNRALGRACLLLYAGFSLERFEAGHRAHHRHPGTVDDPDFHPPGAAFWPWYLAFMRRYVGWREILMPTAIFLALIGPGGVPMGQAVLYWAVPALLSSVQLFAFGTWLPHRVHAGNTPLAPFDDHHRARSSGYGTLRSLFTCFHFGHHHEHHLRPDVPWWGLPALRRARRPP